MAPQLCPLSLLLTRPAAQSLRFADEVVQQFGNRVRLVISPLMAPHFLSPDWPDAPYSSLILTSETGVESSVRLREAGRALPNKAICVGDRTAATARAAGFAAQSAQGDAEALIALILASDDPGPFLHLRGREARGDIAPRLAAKGRPAHATVVYEQQPQPLSVEARELLSGSDPVIVPLFSPRSATLLADFGPFSAPLWLVAISPAVAEKAAILLPQRIETAQAPDALSMLRALGGLIPDPAS